MKSELEKSALIATSLFLLFYYLGAGSIYWPLVAEITTDKGASVAIVNLWFWKLTLSLITPYMFERLPEGQFFLVFSLLSALVSISLVY